MGLQAAVGELSPGGEGLRRDGVEEVGFFKGREEGGEVVGGGREGGAGVIEVEGGERGGGSGGHRRGWRGRRREWILQYHGLYGLAG